MTDLIGMDTASFITDFKTNASLANSNIDLSDSDTGAIGGGDDHTTIPDTLNEDLLNPLEGFDENWPTFEDAIASTLRLGKFINVGLTDATSKSLGIDNVNILSKADDNMSIFDGAITYVSSERAKLGAFQNRLEKAMSASANSEENLTSTESRIRDVDMVNEMMNQTRQSIFAQAMLAQANQQLQSVLQLLD